MRIPIREQLALLVLITTLLSLVVISIATWLNNYNFVVGIISQSLSLTASLKAAQIASELELLQTTCTTITTRLLVQEALGRFNDEGDNSDANWAAPITDIQTALTSFNFIALLQAIIYPRTASGDIHGLLNVTRAAMKTVTLPYNYPNGSAVILGDEGIGYPPLLYPNLTYIQTGGSNASGSSGNMTQVYAFPEVLLNETSSLFLGPLEVNSSLALVSITLPILNVTSIHEVLGFMTVVASASGLSSVLKSREGIGDTALTLLLGPARADNLFSFADQPLTSGSSSDMNTTALQTAAVDYVFSPLPVPGQSDRHSVYNENNESSFPLSEYPAALSVLTTPNLQINNASSQLSTTNEQGSNVAVGVARPQTTLVDWVLILEMDHDAAFAPTAHLRNILLGCVFGTAGLLALLVIPMAHLGVLPILRLTEATKITVLNPEAASHRDDASEHVIERGDTSGADVNAPNSRRTQQSKQDKGFVARLRHFWFTGRWEPAPIAKNPGPRTFTLPRKVQDKKHFITDELTELTSTFNEVSDELIIQYTKLEERVAARTQELEKSKKAAEAANESKTLFVASISHELKTPLNGVLGMCAVCMSDDDLSRVKRSLQVMYKSGDLLLHLLNDLLTFSKNQIGTSISLEEGEFNLSDIKSQIVSLFDKQVREKNVNFKVHFIGTDPSPSISDSSSGNATVNVLTAFGPPGTGRLKDMKLWGDIHRILQVIINLVGNSLKFTPEGGKVEVRVKCIGDVTKSTLGSRHGSTSSKVGSQHGASSGRDSNLGSVSSIDTRNQPNTKHASKSKSQPSGSYVPGGPSVSPPSNARSLEFEFEVEDNGPGIAPHLQQRIFEPFVQGDVSLTKKYGGTGLGLSICSQLATLLGGEIKLRSAVGVGTTFTMQIPLKLVERRASSRSSTTSGSHHQSVPSVEGPHTNAIGPSTSAHYEDDPQPRLIGLSQPFFATTMPLPPDMSSNTHSNSLDRPGSSQSKTNVPKVQILVVEDNLVNQEVVLRLLKLEKINDVAVANDGQEAFDIVKATMNRDIVYDVIFMDIQMPNMDGLQSTRLIRELGYLGPIVALTAFAEESNIKDCMEAGMDMFLSKPIRRPALKQVLDKFSRLPEKY